jgi:hypothetical protein
LENLLEFEDLDEATQLTVVEELAVLAAPTSDVADERRVRAGERIRAMAPRLWQVGSPVLQTVLTEAVKRQLGL